MNFIRTPFRRRVIRRTTMVRSIEFTEREVDDLITTISCYLNPNPQNGDPCGPIFAVRVQKLLEGLKAYRERLIHEQRST